MLTLAHTNIRSCAAPSSWHSIVCCNFCLAASALERLAIPPGTVRVIFKTLNTKKQVLPAPVVYPHKPRLPTLLLPCERCLMLELCTGLSNL